MVKTAAFTPIGVCSKQIELKVTDGIIEDIVITGGCDGNLQGLKNLLLGMDAQEARRRLSGIRCGARETSCPDQISKALEQILKE